MPRLGLALMIFVGLPAIVAIAIRRRRISS
jgi:hypothetical protein